MQLLRHSNSDKAGHTADTQGERPGYRSQAGWPGQWLPPGATLSPVVCLAAAAAEPSDSRESPASVHPASLPPWHTAPTHAPLRLHRQPASCASTRVLRLIKLLRLLQSSPFFGRWAAAADHASRHGRRGAADALAGLPQAQAVPSGRAPAGGGA